MLVQQSTVKEGIASQFFAQPESELRLEYDDTYPNVRREYGATGKVKGRCECKSGEQIRWVEALSGRRRSVKLANDLSRSR